MGRRWKESESEDLPKLIFNASGKKLRMEKDSVTLFSLPFLLLFKHF
jgi:hypothetical protein